MSARIDNPLVGALAGALLLGTVCPAAPPLKLSGSIAGMVANSGGVPQMGATVLLYNRFDRLVQKELTNEKGTFGFDSLVPDVYSVRVSMSSFLPALKRNVVVQPGMQSLLSVSLTSVFSSIELVALAPGQNAIMSDEWKWVLRSASATRPVLRVLPGIDPGARRTRSVFGATHGVVKVSAGDQAQFSSLGNEPDLGTAFALATSILGKNKLEVSGNVGYASNSGTPSAAIRTSFRRDVPGGSSPEVQVTMRQAFLPARVGTAVLAGMDAPVLRSVSAQFLNEARLSDHVRFEYGSSLDTVSFLETLNYFSPYGRLTVEDAEESFQVAYASGTPPAELFMNDGGTAVQLQQDLSALALFPRVSLSGGRARVQRTQSVEAGYSRHVGSRTYSVGIHRITVSNAALTMVGPEGIEPGSDVLPDLFSRSYVLNAGKYRNAGYSASFVQSLGKNLDAAIAWAVGDTLTAKEVEQVLLAELGEALQRTRRHSLTARMSGTLPSSGTQFVTSYQWANVNGLTPPHLYMTQRVRDGLGLNVRVRQQIPTLGGLPGRFEASADFRNMLAQGYVPLNAAGRRVLLMHTPRTVRGGVSFIF